MSKKYKMNFKLFFKLFSIIFLFIIFSVPTFAMDEEANFLSEIVIEKPMDNNYRLNLYFKNHFQGNAFIQKVKNGSFYVFIPDTVMSSKNIKVVYKNKVNKSDVKITIAQQPYIKDSAQSKYLKLSVQTPVNHDITLVAKTLIPQQNNALTSFINFYSVIITVLLLLIIGISISIIKALKTSNKYSQSYTLFPADFLVKKENSNNEYSDNFDVDGKVISPIEMNDFSCFDLPVQNGEKGSSLYSAIAKRLETQKPSFNEKVVVEKTANTVNSDNNEPDLENSSVEDTAEIELNEDNSQQDDYRPELISELKIAENKGFYLTTVGDNSFALFGYVFDKIFFLQKFTDLTQINLQARFYDNKDGSDLYIVRLDSYKAMLAITDTEIKELAII